MKLFFGPALTRGIARSCLLVLGLTITGSGTRHETTAARVLPNPIEVMSTEPVDLDAINQIKEAEAKRSQVMDLVGYLTDVVGPRLTGSPNLKKAQQYAMERMREWGVANVHPEAWQFGRGWSLAGFSASMITPTFGSLIAYPKAWSPSTNGTVRGEVVLMDAKTVADLARYKGKLKGKIVMLTAARPVAADFTPQAQRTSDEELLQLANARPPTGEAQRFHLPLYS